MVLAAALTPCEEITSVRLSFTPTPRERSESEPVRTAPCTGFAI